MVYLNLQHQVFQEINMEINVKEDQKLEIEVNFSFNVSYSDDGKRCMATLEQKARAMDAPPQFFISVKGIGFFDCEGINSDEDKKQAHIQAYNALFPYVQDLIAQLTVRAGMSPLMIRKEKMELERVTLDSQK